MPETQTGTGPIPRRGQARPLVTIDEQWSGRTLPALVQANSPGVDLARWAGQHAETVRALGRRAGGVLMRGFDVPGPAGFAAAVTALCGDALTYGERSSPRTEVIDQIYTSTEHPADQPIVLHNEQSYTLDWPMRIVFYCDEEPEHGGNTPLADSRAVLGRLRPTTVQRFDELGIRYVRNYLRGISLPWPEVFGTTDPGEVEKYCREHDITAQWIGADGLRTSQIRRAVHIHPETGQRTWFNHALFFHVTSVPDEIRDGLRTAFTDDQLPYNTYYGDGSPIPGEALDELRAAYEAETTTFGWRRHDVLYLDNMLVAHGREPFKGRRRILTAMAEPVQGRGRP
jgi:alpha-ketoglutarate-dependent taurine dioxygenase